eukprot:255728_1
MIYWSNIYNHQRLNRSSKAMQRYIINAQLNPKQNSEYCTHLNGAYGLQLIGFISTEQTQVLRANSYTQRRDHKLSVLGKRRHTFWYFSCDKVSACTTVVCYLWDFSQQQYRDVVNGESIYCLNMDIDLILE